MQKKILDHGYVELIEKWGSDQGIVESARMSTGKGFLGWDGGVCPECEGNRKVMGTEELFQQHPEHWGRTCAIFEGVKRTLLPATKVCNACNGSGKVAGDAKLLKYMWDNNHATPFEFGGMIIEVKAPIMVYREWHRHRGQGYSEASARYTPLPDDNYMPTVERCMMTSAGSRQSSTAAGAAALTAPDCLTWLSQLADVYDHAERVYQDGLRIGIPKELARLPVPVGRYSKMRATTNLRMWLAFGTLRSTAKNEHAQWEIRQYADAAMELIGEHFPRTYGLFDQKKAA